jgi:hypothetical protein
MNQEIPLTPFSRLLQYDNLLVAERVEATIGSIKTAVIFAFGSLRRGSGSGFCYSATPPFQGGMVCTNLYLSPLERGIQGDCISFHHNSRSHE